MIAGRESIDISLWTSTCEVFLCENVGTNEIHLVKHTSSCKHMSITRSHTQTHTNPLSLPCMDRGCDNACSSPPSMSSPKWSGRCVHTGSTQSQSTRGPGRALKTLPFGSWTWLVWSGSPSPEGSPCVPGSKPQFLLTGERHLPVEGKMNEKPLTDAQN